MCGILGYVSLNKKNIDKFPIRKILNTLNHRGPDSSKYIKIKNCYFGHTRLSIIGIDEKKAFQPVMEGNKALTFNGEIYNYKEISEILNNSGIKDSGKSDTETLFNCLNFYKTDTSNTPAVIYNSNDNKYLPTSSLQIDFKIKIPRNPSETGTIIHLPGAYAVSVVTGSTVDEYNRTK